MKIAITALLALFVLSGCEYLEKARGVSAKGVAYLHQAECSVSLDQRKENALAIQRELVADGSLGRVIAQDCNGDGTPDFELTQPLPE